MNAGNKAGDFEPFHAMLKRYRLKSGKTQRQAALHHKWANTFYSDVERGSRLPQLAAGGVASLASYLGGEWRPLVVAYVCAKLHEGDPYYLAEAFSIYRRLGIPDRLSDAECEARHRQSERADFLAAKTGGE